MLPARRSAIAGDKIDVPKVITKSDAEKILGVPVKDAKGRNQNGTGGYYDSEWSYRAIEGDKGLYFDVLYAGRDAPPHLTQTMFSMLPADGSKSTRIDGLGDKAIFCPNETGMAMLHVLKGDILDHDWNSRSSRERGARLRKIDGHKNSCEPVVRLARPRSKVRRLVESVSPRRSYGARNLWIELSPSAASSTHPKLPEYSPEPSTAPAHTRARKCLAGSTRTRASLAC